MTGSSRTALGQKRKLVNCILLMRRQFYERLLPPISGHSPNQKVALVKGSAVVRTLDVRFFGSTQHKDLHGERPDRVDSSRSVVWLLNGC